MKTDFTEKEYAKYESKYSEDGLFAMISKYAVKMGGSMLYGMLCLFYASQKAPAKYRAIIYGALGYAILPFDIIPDFIPVIGLTDDIGVIASAVAACAFLIDDDVKARAKAKMRDLLPNDIYDMYEADLDKDDNTINMSKVG